MMNPADQPQPTSLQRAADSPTLWLSLALGSVLIHLILFILASIVSTQTAKVQLELAPIAVEFVDPTATTVRSTAPRRAIAARPGTPSSIPPSSTQAQPTVPLRSSSLNRPIEQPFVPPQPIKRKPTPTRPRQPQPSFTRPQPSQPQPNQPQPGAANNPLPQQSNPIQPSPPKPSNHPSQEGLPQNGLPSDLPGSNGEQPSDQQQPGESGTKIVQAPEGGSVLVVVLEPRQGYFDNQQQPARAIDLQKTLLIRYPAAVAQIPGRSLKIEVPLIINDKGLFVDTGEIRPLSPANIPLDQTDLKSIANQIFATWRFEPAYNGSGTALHKPPMSNLIIEAQIQFL